VNYDRIVTAALSETKSRFALAEALALDIPQRDPGVKAAGDTTEPIDVYLREAREQIIAAGGEPRSVETLRQIRSTALWAAAGDGTFRWVPGRSFTSHNHVRAYGWSFEAFLAATDEVLRDVQEKSQMHRARSSFRQLPERVRLELAREVLAQPAMPASNRGKQAPPSPTVVGELRRARSIIARTARWGKVAGDELDQVLKETDLIREALDTAAEVWGTAEIQNEMTTEMREIDGAR